MQHRRLELGKSQPNMELFRSISTHLSLLLFGAKDVQHVGSRSLLGHTLCGALLCELVERLYGCSASADVILWCGGCDVKEFINVSTRTLAVFDSSFEYRFRGSITPSSKTFSWGDVDIMTDGDCVLHSRQRYSRRSVGRLLREKDKQL